MPSLFTHQLIAERTFSQLPEHLQQKINKPAVYSLGAQGADLFFFHKLHAGTKNNLGGKLHKVNIYQTFSALQRQLVRMHQKYADYLHALEKQDCQPEILTQEVAQSAKDIAIFQSYIAGYITHYVADTVFHPFIYAMEEKFLQLEPKWRGKRHVYIENDIDSFLLQQCKGVAATDYHLSFAIDEVDMPSLCTTLRILCYEAGYPNFTYQQLKQILKRINLYAKLTRDEKQMRRLLFNGIESMLFLPHIFSVTMHRNSVDELCVNTKHEPWINPSCKEVVRTESALELFEQAVAESAIVLATFFESVEKNTELPKEVFSKHFLSGLDESLPHVVTKKKK